MDQIVNLVAGVGENEAHCCCGSVMACCCWRHRHQHCWLLLLEGPCRHRHCNSANNSQRDGNKEKARSEAHITRTCAQIDACSSCLLPEWSPSTTSGGWDRYYGEARPHHAMMCCPALVQFTAGLGHLQFLTCTQAEGCCKIRVCSLTAKA